MILGVMLNCDTQPEMMGAFLHAPLVNAMLKREKKGMHLAYKCSKTTYNCSRQGLHGHLCK